MAKERIKVPVVYTVVYTPHSQAVCKDCGKCGCLVPVPHKP